MSEIRKIAAILVADIVGYSRLAGADEDPTLSRPRGLSSDLIDPATDAHQSCDVSAGTNWKTENQREERMRLNRRCVNVGLAASLVAPGAVRHRLRRRRRKIRARGRQDRARSGPQGGRRARQRSRTH